MLEVAWPPGVVHVHLDLEADQAIRNAIVCLDLNANSACDADEPASARTNADGAYSVVAEATVPGAGSVLPQ